MFFSRIVDERFGISDLSRQGSLIKNALRVYIRVKTVVCFAGWKNYSRLPRDTVYRRAIGIRSTSTVYKGVEDR